MLLRILPWKFFVTRIARAYGFLDPIHFLGKLRSFAQPSEVGEPVELLRAGVLFHARGLINTKAIQNNLDWIWPYWVERQFNPHDPAFIPRAFSFSHINLTHRNWTAVGLPDIPFYPVIDPRGLVTPLFDGWSLDFWLIGKNGQRTLFPSRLDSVTQELHTGDNLVVTTLAQQENWSLKTRVWVGMDGKAPRCQISVEATGDSDTLLAVAVRPYNPEGISFIETISIDKGQEMETWRVNDRDQILFGTRPVKRLLSNYHEGDVWHQLPESQERTTIQCPVSMASGAALFHLHQLPLVIHLPLLDDFDHHRTQFNQPLSSWSEEMDTLSKAQLPNPQWQQLYDQAVRTLVLHCPGEVFPGPYTYKRFWFRDAAFILHALLLLGGARRVQKCLHSFPDLQARSGYFKSQDGEWDSNGEVLWLLHRFWKLTGEPLTSTARWRVAVQRGADWILKKRLPEKPESSVAGLLPAGFSAEHLGPNDYYYWDNFWGIAGLQCAADLMQGVDDEVAQKFREEGRRYLDTVIRSFRHMPDRQKRGSLAASPKRRMDAGAIGSLVADYPLQLFPAGEIRITRTVDWLLAHSMHEGGFFQNMIHSGTNAYLTLHMAQVLLRAGDSRYLDLMQVVADLASPTGQWPEAIHPHTQGGCMGDGQHVWAAAEWLVMLRNLFVREEGDQLLIGSGIPSEWWTADGPIFFGPTLTQHGPVSVQFSRSAGESWQVEVRSEHPLPWDRVEVAPPGLHAIPNGEPGHYTLQPQEISV